MQKEISFINRLKKIISFPVFLFIGILIVASITFLGRKHTLGTIEQVAQEDSNQLGQVLGVSYDPEDYKELDSPVIYQCAFDEAPMDACKIEYPIFSNPEIERDIVLVPETESTIPINPSGPTGGTTCETVLNDNDNKEEATQIYVDFVFTICNDRGDLAARFRNKDNPSDTAFLGHAQFAIRSPSGAKIDGYEQGSWLVPQFGEWISWSKDLPPDLAIQDLVGEIMTDFVPGGSACTVVASHCNTTPPPQPPPPEEGSLDTTWKAEWIGAVQIDKFRGVKYFASDQYSASDVTPDYANSGISNKRLSRTIYEPLADKILTYSTSKFVPGYVTLSNSLITAKPHYYHGNAVLKASMGPENDFTDSDYKLPWQFITSRQVQEDIEAESTHESSYTKFIEWIEKIFDFLEFDRCSGVEKINRTYKYDSTTGKKTVFSIGQYFFTVYDIIFKSNLASTIGLQCEQFEPGQCLISTDLSSCNINNENFTYENGQIVFEQDREDDFVICLLSKEIKVRHKLDGFDKFTFNAGLFVLENYWKRLQTYADDKSICHWEQVKKKKNVGVRARYKVWLFDQYIDNCGDIENSDTCEPDPTIDCNTSYSQTATAFLPFLGEVPVGMGYLDLVQVSKEDDIPDLPECPSNSDFGLCYCQENQVDTLTCYLLEKGVINTEKEAALSGVSIYEEAESLTEKPVQIYDSYIDALRDVCQDLYY